MSILDLIGPDSFYHPSRMTDPLVCTVSIRPRVDVVQKWESQASFYRRIMDTAERHGAWPWPRDFWLEYEE